MAQSLPEAMHSRTTDDICDLYSRLLGEIVRRHNPRTTDDVRVLDPEYRGEGLVYLIDEHLRGREPEGVPFWKVDMWREWLRDSDTDRHADELLTDPQVYSVEDVIGWFCWHERRLFPDMKDDDGL